MVIQTMPAKSSNTTTVRLIRHGRLSPAAIFFRSPTPERPSGSPTATSIVLWTRLALPGLFGSRLGDDPVTVRWEMAHDEAFSRPVQSGQAIASAALAHSVHVEVGGLDPDRWYWYRFMAGDAVSQSGRTRTFPAPDAPAARLRLAYASCQRWEHGYYGAYRHMRQEDVDAVVFLG